MKNIKFKLLVSIFAVGQSIATIAAVPTEMPELFREAADAPGGVLSFATSIEDEVFATGNRAAAESRKWTILGMIVEIDRYRNKEQLLVNVPKWLLPCGNRACHCIKGDCPQGLRGECPCAKGDCPCAKGDAAVNFAYAEMLDSAARLYDRPDFAARAAYMRETLAKNGFLLNNVVCCKGSVPNCRGSVPRNCGDNCGGSVPRKSARVELVERVREELKNGIRPGGVGGQEFWNVNAQMFMYPPAFGFASVKNAVKYRFQVMDDRQYAHVFEADGPTASLLPVWEFLPRGLTAVFCFGIDGEGNVCGMAGERRFWKQAPYEPGAYPAAKRSYAQAQRMLCEYILDMPETAGMEKNGRPDLAERSNFTSYPSKMQSALIRAMLSLARIAPEKKDRALAIAKKSADYLISKSQPEGAPLEYFTPTYEGDGQLSGAYSGMHMLIYPADAGAAFVNLAAATGEAKYLDAAKRIAGTYLKLQGEDGTWYLKMYEKDGSPVSDNRLVPTSVIAFLESLHAATGEAKYRDAADRAFAFIDNGPLKTWNWEGQFEDIKPADGKFKNLTKHNACDTAIYMLKRFPGDKVRLAQAREIVRYAEDQFVMWRRPCRADGAGYKLAQTYPYETWMTPVALEQYSCYAPIDGSVAKLIRTWLALWAAEGNPLDLAKARTLGDATVNMQEPNGRVRTYWVPEPVDGTPLGEIARQPEGGDWLGCLQADEWALGLLAEAAGQAR